MAHGGAKGCLADGRFRTRIDEQGEILRVLDPAGQKTPAHQHGPTVGQVTAALLPFTLQHDQDRLCGRDVETGRKIFKADQVKIIGNLFRCRFEHETSAHRLLLRPGDRIK
ncbi:hypothetical protein D3C80_1555000 [compost metagenome]